MRYITIFILCLFLLSCNKQPGSNENQQTSNQSGHIDHSNIMASLMMVLDDVYAKRMQNEPAKPETQKTLSQASQLYKQNNTLKLFQNI